VTHSSKPEICSYENSPWRTEFWRGRDYEDLAERIAIAEILPPRGKRLCEIGAGFGRLADFYLGYDRILLIDYALTMLREAREHILNDPRLSSYASRITFVAADLYNLPLADSSLDTAITVRVLHHVTDIPRAFAEISRVVRPQGTYLTEFANKRHLKSRLRYLLTGHLPNPNDLEPYEFVKLNFDFHPRYIESHLRTVNFVIQKKRAVSLFRIAALKRIVPANLLAALDGNFQSLISNLDLSPSIFLRNLSTKPGSPALNSTLWRCPVCGSIKLDESSDEMTCQSCSRRYPITDSIINFRV